MGKLLILKFIRVYLNYNENLKKIDENAFGLLDNSDGCTENLRYIEIYDGGLETISPKLLPWDKINVGIVGTPANCDPNMDWLFQNSTYRVRLESSPKYMDTT
jgi:hypothetical protein